MNGFVAKTKTIYMERCDKIYISFFGSADPVMAPFPHWCSTRSLFDPQPIFYLDVTNTTPNWQIELSLSREVTKQCGTQPMFIDIVLPPPDNSPLMWNITTKWHMWQTSVQQLVFIAVLLLFTELSE